MAGTGPVAEVDIVLNIWTADRRVPAHSLRLETEVARVNTVGGW